MNKTFVFKLDERQYSELKKSAFALNKSMGRFIREALLDSIERIRENENTQ